MWGWKACVRETADTIWEAAYLQQCSAPLHYVGSLALICHLRSPCCRIRSHRCAAAGALRRRPQLTLVAPPPFITRLPPSDSRAHPTHPGEDAFPVGSDRGDRRCRGSTRTAVKAVTILCSRLTCHWRLLTSCLLIGLKRGIDVWIVSLPMISPERAGMRPVGIWGYDLFCLK